MRYKIVAQAFRGPAAVVCRRCHHRIVLPDSARVIQWDDGLRTFVVSAVDRNMLHKCGRKLEWVCLECHQVYAPKEMKYVKKRNKRKEPDTRCQYCWAGKLIQRETLITESYEF